MGQNGEGSGMNIGYHSVAFGLGETFEYLDVDICYRTCYVKAI